MEVDVEFSQVDELLKSRESIQSSFSSGSQMRRHTNSSSNLGGSGAATEEKPTVTSEESPTRDKSAKKKWYGMNFKVDKKV